MARFLLWNINKKNRDLLIQSMVREHKIDILLLVEYEPARTSSDLSNLLLAEGLVKRGISERFGVFGRVEYGMELVKVMNKGRVEIWNWTPENGMDGRLALVHGPDRLHNDDGTRRVFFRRIAKLVAELEKVTHGRTMIVGDFNAQPFESAILSADGLHAIGVREVKNLTTRTVRGGKDKKAFFYNPMWGLYGLNRPGAAGMATHYWENNLAGELIWHMLDQVVIRPEECRRFRENELKILSRIGTVELLKPDGRPDLGVGSDHLPIIFCWDLDRGESHVEPNCLA